MPGDASSEQDAEDSDSEFVEIDPTGRYGRYKEVLGKGAFKKVYKAFDELEGIEVAWNQIKVADLLRNSEDLERLYSEVHLLKTLKHKNIIKFYNSWVDTKHDNINIITEIFTSGTLRQYRKRHKHVDLRALKNWSRQILRGLLYLHSNNPPIIHRDLKCDNILVNGNQGEVKIGDLGLAAILRQAHAAHSVIGTPEFMAPELYEEEYNELVDIYAFGMCLLELVTVEYPYVECANAAQIYKKVTSGIKPASLAKVKDPGVREFIEKCIANASKRLSARELLKDPFLLYDSESESVDRPLQPDVTRSGKKSSESASTEEPSLHDNTPNLDLENPKTVIRSPSHAEIADAEDGGEQFDTKASSMSNKEALSEASRDFTVKGQRKDVNTIFLRLCIADSKGHVRNIHFPFDIEADTALSVASEMVTELDLSDQDVTTIAEMIDLEIQAHVPDWSMGEALDDTFADEVGISEDHDCQTKDELPALFSEPDYPSGELTLERLPSGRKYWFDSPKALSKGCPPRSAQSNLSHQSEACVDDTCSTEVFEQEDSQDNKNNKINSPNVVVSSLSSHHEGDPTSSHQSKDKPSADFERESTSSNGLIEEIKQEKQEVGNNNDSQLVCNKNGSPAEFYDGQSICSRSAESSPEDPYGSLKENEPKGVNIITQKLEHLLAEHQKQLYELKRTHRLEIWELLKELPPEFQTRTVNMCLRQVPDYNIQKEECDNAMTCLNALKSDD